MLRNMLNDQNCCKDRRTSLNRLTKWFNDVRKVYMQNQPDVQNDGRRSLNRLRRWFRVACGCTQKCFPCVTKIRINLLHPWWCRVQWTTSNVHKIVCTSCSILFKALGRHFRKEKFLQMKNMIGNIATEILAW